MRRTELAHLIRARTAISGDAADGERQKRGSENAHADF